MFVELKFTPGYGANYDGMGMQVQRSVSIRNQLPYHLTIVYLFALFKVFVLELGADTCHLTADESRQVRTGSLTLRVLI